VVSCKEKAITFGDLEDPNSVVRELLESNFSIRRKPALGTQPEVYYLV
jgi:molybdopterin-containing oxidoreductase family iron-sulfur binding subunit